MVLASFAACAALFLIEGVSLMKQKMWKETITLSCIVGLSFMLIVLFAYGLPSPLKILHGWLRPIGESILNF
ncbi:hypothetical protein [Paenibacillus ehimensis]|uniref:Uncharacterized protein n=1 Tax=Paenibacillus ehimensis TaxID=79264 RepID=A0ABT8V3U7_9BACL|nr:hypothetical protein [Paenibacillus ehimensis]MDO3675408.1 hypothetical protein [Paenibacillus ehimensis]